MNLAIKKIFSNHQKCHKHKLPKLKPITKNEKIDLPVNTSIGTFTDVLDYRVIVNKNTQ